MAQCTNPIRRKLSSGVNELRRHLKGMSTQYVDYPCGRCAGCLQNKRDEWSVRLMIEHKYASSAAFITLTYSDEFWFDYILKADNMEQAILDSKQVHKKHLQDFLKRFRYYDGNQGIRYYGVGEYGSKSDRPHYHLIMFNHNHSKLADTLSSAWQCGITDIGDVTDASINYVSGYVLNSSYAPFEGANKSFSLMSRRPPLGSVHFEQYADHYMEHDQVYIQINGTKRRIPRLFRDKMFTSSHLDRAIQKLDIQDITIPAYHRRMNNDGQFKQRFTKNKKL